MKPDLIQINTLDYDQDPSRYELRSGLEKEAPTCPFGGRFKWIGYDKKEQKYVRFNTKVFKIAIQKVDPDFVLANDAAHKFYKEQIENLSRGTVD